MRIQSYIMRKKTNKPVTFRVVALLHEDILASSITLPMEILAGAAQALGRGAQHSLSFQCLSEQGGPLTLQSGLTVATEPFDALTAADLLIIPAIWRQPQRVLQKNPRHIAVITQHLSKRGLTVSIGSGSFLLATTGQMSGRSD